MSRTTTAQRRIMREAKELMEPTDQYYAAPLEDNIFEWHFTIRGPPDTPYEGGRYHGRISLPSEYPMKPPNIILLTPNGRFQENQKICLTISAHHPESWQPSWSIRTVLLALISFMPTPGDGAIGAVECSDEERRRLAQKSLNWKCPGCNAHMATVLDDSKKCGELSDSDKEAMKTMQTIGFSAPKKDAPQKEEQKKVRTGEEPPTITDDKKYAEATQAEAEAKDDSSSKDVADTNPQTPAQEPTQPSTERKKKQEFLRAQIAALKARPQQPPMSIGIGIAIFGIILSIVALVMRKYGDDLI